MFSGTFNIGKKLQVKINWRQLPTPIWLKNNFVLNVEKYLATTW